MFDKVNQFRNVKANFFQLVDAGIPENDKMMAKKYLDHLEKIIKVIDDTSKHLTNLKNEAKALTKQQKDSILPSIEVKEKLNSIYTRIHKISCKVINNDLLKQMDDTYNMYMNTVSKHLQSPNQSDTESTNSKTMSSL